MEEDSESEEKDKIPRVWQWLSEAFTPSSSSIKEFRLLKREHPVIFKLTVYVPIFLLVFLMISTSLYTGIYYYSYLPDREKTMNVSTQEAKNTLSTYELFENFKMGDYIYKPINWRLESSNPVGSWEDNNFTSSINFTQRHQTLQIIYEGIFFQSVNEEKIALENLLNESGYNITLSVSGDRYTSSSEDFLVTAGMIEESSDNKFDINLYYSGVNYSRARDIISSFDGMIEDERLLLKELDTPPTNRLHSELTSAKMVDYWKLKTGTVRGTSLEYLKGLLNRQQVSGFLRCRRWMANGTESNLETARPAEYLELIQGFVEERYESTSGSEINCRDYTRTFIEAFYFSKKRVQNPYIDGVVLFPAKSSKIIPGVVDSGHRYIGILSLRDEGIQISFVDSQWGAEDFPSLKHVFMPTRRSRFDALDPYHHLSFYRTGWWDYQMERSRRDLIIGAVSLMLLYFFFLYFLIRIERGIDRDWEKSKEH